MPVRHSNLGRVMLPIFLISAWILAPSVARTESPAGTQEISGTVYLDRNSNGVRDPEETGIAGVSVSDQSEVTLTDEEGHYTLKASAAGGLVWVSQPNGYLVEGSFWRPVDGSSRIDFGLSESPPPTEFLFIHASDTHVSNESLARIRKLRTLVETIRPAFVLVTGDLIRDALRVPEEEARGYYELYVREIREFPVPVWSVPGNHENFGIERHRSLVSPEHPLYAKGMYRHYLGPNYYSFNYGGVHFVGLDSVDIDDLWYYGHVDPAQLGWLKRDAELAGGLPIVTYNHIPFFSAALSVFGYFDDPPAPSLIKVGDKTVYRHVVSNAAEVFKVLAPHRFVLALGGHNHAQEALTFKIEGLDVRFHQTAAVVGPNRSNEMIMPSGVTLYSVKQGMVDNGRFLALDGSE